MVEAQEIVTLHDNFYRDSFSKVLLLVVGVFLVFLALVTLSIFLYVQKPKPITFYVNDGFRIQPSIPLDQPYLAEPDMLQWVNDVFSKIFVLDFVRYADELNAAKQYFTEDGWKVYLNQIGNYASKEFVMDGKVFVSATPTGAPVIFRKGVLPGRFGWQVNVPLTINYVSNVQNTAKSLTFQVLIVRVPTENNLSGISIDNMIVLNSDETSSNSGQ